MALRNRTKVLVGAAAVVAALLVALGVWTRLPRAPAPRLWSAADLPALPAPEDNALALVPDASDELPDALRDLLAGEPRWEDVEAQRDAFEALSGLLLLEELHQKPLLQDTCPLELAARCRHLELDRFHRRSTLELLRLGLQKQWDQAFTTAARQLELDDHFASTSRTMLAHMVALHDLRRTLHIAGALLSGWERGTESVAEGSFERLAQALERLDESKLGPERSVAAEYLLFLSALDTVAKKNEGSVRLLLDREDTVSQANVHFQALMTLAKAPDGPRPGPMARRTGLARWLINPAGNRLLELLDVAQENVVVRLCDERRALLADRDALLARVRARLAEGPRE